MPKSPIQSRTTFFFTNKIDKTMRQSQFNTVDTAIGPCVEPRAMSLTNIGAGQVTDIDAYDNGVNRIEMMDDGQFFSTYGSGGNQVSEDFSPQS